MMKHLERGLDNQNQWWKYLIVFVITYVYDNDGLPVSAQKKMLNGQGYTVELEFEYMDKLKL